MPSIGEHLRTLNDAIGVKRFSLNPLNHFIAIGVGLLVSAGFVWLAEVPIFVIAAPILLLAVLWWVLSYATQLRLAALPRIEFLEIVERETIMETGAAEQVFYLRIRNSGSALLEACLVKVDNLSGRASGAFPFTSCALVTTAQAAGLRTGSFNLRAGEIKEIRVCHSRRTGGNTFSLVDVEYEDIPEAFDPEYINQMDVGVYSEAPPLRLRLVFSRTNAGKIAITPYDA